MNQLTQQQQAVLDYIQHCLNLRGYGPTVREIGEHMEIRSPNGVMCHLRALEKKGFISRAANKSRAIELAHSLRSTNGNQAIVGFISGGLVQFSPVAGGHLNIAKTLNSPDCFWLTVRDDHLLTYNIKSGDHLLVSKIGSPNAGQLVVAQTNENNQKLLGVVQIESGQLRVSPVLPMAIQPATAFNLYGIVIGVVRMFA